MRRLFLILMLLAAVIATAASQTANIGDFIFNQNAVKRLTLKQTNTPTGFITRDGQVHSFLKDYQGNIRQVLNEQGAVEQESHYYPYGMLMGESSLTKPNDADANRYRFSGKEYVTAAGLNLYDFSARYFSPDGIGFWGSDPMQSDYASLSPTAYCAADPINKIDPTGNYIQGVSKEDIKLTSEDICTIFSDDVFAGFRDLIKIDGKRIASIDEAALSKAFEGITLNEDQQALVDIAVNTINSKDKHVVEYAMNDGVLSYSGTKMFDELLDLDYIIREATLNMYNGRIPAIIIATEYGGGATKFSKKGSHSVVVNDAAHTVNRAVTFGHEVFGHGRSHAVSIYLDQHVEVIRTENLITRIMGIPFVNDGRNHTPRTIIEKPSLLPSFR